MESSLGSSGSPVQAESLSSSVQSLHLRGLADRLDGMEASERGAVDSDLMMIMSTIFTHDRFSVESA